MRSLLAPLLFSMLSASCAERLVATNNGTESAGGGANGGPVQGPALPRKSGNFEHEVLEDGSVRTRVDATDTEAWQRLDLDTGSADDSAWDLQFRRFYVLSNGGVTGKGGVRSLKLTDAQFEEVVAVPEGAQFRVDTEDGEDEGDVFDSVFNDGLDDWYDYALAHHTLTSRGYVYIVRSTERRYFKLTLEDYYDDVGTSGIVTFRWARLESPDEPADESPDDEEGPPEGDAPEGNPPDDEPPDEEQPPNEPPDEEPPAEEAIDEEPPDDERPGDEPSDLVRYSVDATSYELMTYVSLEHGVLPPDAESASLAWDLAFLRYNIFTNSGTSGPGQGGAKLDDSGLPYEELMSVSPDGFVPDEVLPADGAPGSVEGTKNSVLQDWYDYQGLGALTPKAQTFVIRTATGTYGKLRIWRYASGVFEISFLPVSVEN